MNEFDEELDARGLNCPLPILRAKKALKALEVSQIVKVIATDPSSTDDFEAFCRQTDNELLSSEVKEGEYTFYIKKVA